MTDESMIMLGSPPPEPVRKVRADARERAERTWNARLAGLTWRQAAEVAGLSSAQNAMRCVREAYGQVPEVDREERRHLWRERTEVLWRHGFQDVRDGKQGAVIAATKNRPVRRVPRRPRSSAADRRRGGGRARRPRLVDEGGGA